MQIENTSQTIKGIIKLARRGISEETEFKEGAGKRGNDVTRMREFAKQIQNHPNLQDLPRERQEALSKAVEFASDNSHSNPDMKRGALFDALTSIAQLKPPLSEKKSAERQDFLDFLKENDFVI